MDSVPARRETTQRTYQRHGRKTQTRSFLIFLLIIICRSKLSATYACTQERNHIFKVGGPISWSMVLLPFYIKIRQVYPVWCSRLHNHTLFIKKLCKKLGVVQILGRSGPRDYPSGCVHACTVIVRNRLFVNNYGNHEPIRTKFYTVTRVQMWHFPGNFGRLRSKAAKMALKKKQTFCQRDKISLFFDFISIFIIVSCQHCQAYVLLVYTMSQKHLNLFLLCVGKIWTNFNKKISRYDMENTLNKKKRRKIRYIKFPNVVIAFILGEVDILHNFV